MRPGYPDAHVFRHWLLLLNIILNLALIGPMGHGGLALAPSLRERPMSLLHRIAIPETEMAEQLENFDGTG
jgi:peptidoglycan biosynthesis protein MviN/MurJ (putative lipid II flippase)